MSLIYGHGTEERIVAVENVYAQGVAGSRVHIFTRNKDGVVTDRYERIKPFLYASSNEPSVAEMLGGGSPYEGVEAYELEGPGFYNTLIVAENAWNLKNFTENVKDDDFIMDPNRATKYLIETGNTYFKGMSFKDLKVAYVDIEVISTGNFPNSKIAGDTIIVISVLCSDGERRVFALDDEINNGQFDPHITTIDTEKSLLKLFVTYLTKLNPDVICGHNINNFDLPYIADRCSLHGVPFNIGRNGESPRFFDTKMKLAERDVDYKNWQVYGRHVMDTQLLAMKVDVVKRDMPGYGLKVLVRDYLHKAAENRVYIEGDQIKEMWKTEKKTVLKYALDDVIETEILLKAFGQAYFYLAQMLPFGLQDCARLGSGTLFEQIFIREYHRQGHSLPRKQEEQDIPGGFAGIFKFGHIDKNCIYLDVQSLYPTLAVLLLIQPKRDVLKIYQPIIRELKDFRISIKSRRDSTNDPDEKEELSATDGAIKIVLNTGSYGILASGYFMWNDYDEAARITINGQRIIKTMMRAASDYGGAVVKVDTDGMLVALPDNVRGESGEKVFAKSVEDYVNDLVADGLFDGAFDQDLGIEQKLELATETQEEEA